VTDAATFTWVDPTGTEWNLSDPDTNRYWITTQPKGLGAIPTTITTTPRARGGVTIRSTQLAVRRVTFGLFVEGDTHDDYVTLWRSLGQALTSTRYLGAGQFRVGRPDGTTRQIDAVYEAGYDTEDPDLGVTCDTMAVTLLCPQPEWRALDEVTVTSSYSPTSGSFLSPYPNVSSGLDLGEITVNNPGSVVVWPSWTLNGPASSVTATNHTTGESFTVDPNAAAIAYGDLSGSDIVTIVTDPAEITGPGAGNWQGSLAWGSVLWGLRPGDNDIEFSVTADGAGTSLTMTYIPAYETA
jgi:hypothetical protein